MATQQTSAVPRTPPRLPPEYTTGMMAVYHLKTCWPCLVLAGFPTAGLFLISLYVYGRVHETGQPGLGVCLFLVCFFFVLFQQRLYKLSGLSKCRTERRPSDTDSVAMVTQFRWQPSARVVTCARRRVTLMKLNYWGTALARMCIFSWVNSFLMTMYFYYIVYEVNTVLVAAVRFCDRKRARAP